MYCSSAEHTTPVVVSPCWAQKVFKRSNSSFGSRAPIDRVFAVWIDHLRFWFSMFDTPFRDVIHASGQGYHIALHIASPFFAFFRPFRRFLRWNGRTTRHQREKPPQRRTGGQIRPLRLRARPLCARRLARLPVRSALRRSGRGAGVFRARRPCPRSAPRARRSRLRRPRC